MTAEKAIARMVAYLRLDEWYYTHDNLCALGRWLVDEKDYDAKDLLYFFSKPWKYDDEWNEYRNSLEPKP